MRCKVAILARQPMGFLRDKSLKRVRAGPAVAPPEPWPCACGQTSKHPARRSPRARQQARLHAEEFRPPPPSQNPKTGRAPSRSALAAGKQRRPAPTQRPLPHRGKAAPSEEIRTLAANDIFPRTEWPRGCDKPLLHQEWSRALTKPANAKITQINSI